MSPRPIALPGPILLRYHTTFAAAIAADICVFDSKTREIRFNGLRYLVHLDEFGVPDLTDHPLLTILDRALEARKAVAS